MNINNLSKEDLEELEMKFRGDLKDNFELLYDGISTLSEAKKEYDSWPETKMLKKIDPQSYQDTWDEFAWHLENERGLSK